MLDTLVVVYGGVDPSRHLGLREPCIGAKLGYSAPHPFDDLLRVFHGLQQNLLRAGVKPSYMMVMRRAPDNPDDLADYLLANDPELRRLTRRLHRHQTRLKRAVSPEQYRLYLGVEEVTNERQFVLLERVWTAARPRSRRDGRRAARR
jgi:hypothetical protein